MAVTHLSLPTSTYSLSAVGTRRRYRTFAAWRLQQTTALYCNTLSTSYELHYTFFILLLQDKTKYILAIFSLPRQHSFKFINVLAVLFVIFSNHVSSNDFEQLLRYKALLSCFLMLYSIC